MRKTFLPFALPNTNNTEIEAAAEAIRSSWVTTSPKTRQFEQEFAAAVGAKHGEAVNSCTAAMHLTLVSTNLEPGSPFLSKTEGMIRFYPEGRRPLEKQQWSPHLAEVRDKLLQA